VTVAEPSFFAAFAWERFLPWLPGMQFGNTSLSLAPLWERDRIVLVPAVVAARLGAEGGCQEVAPRETLRRFDELPSRNRSSVREFAVAARLAMGDLRDSDDVRVHVLVRGAICDGRVKGVRAGAPADDPGARRAAELRRLVRAIEARGRIACDGRRYKLVADLDLARLPDRDSYEVVGREPARAMLARMAEAPGVDGQLSTLLGQARAKLTADWRPPLGTPDGLILLRRVPVVAAVVREPAVTPSQLQALAAAGWIEVELVDTQGRPVAALCRLELPDSTPIEARDDVIAHRNFAPGLCRVCLPGLDAARWDVKA
jgi:hypothetical protein